MPSRSSVRVVRDDDADRHGPGMRARIADPESSSFAMKPRTRLLARRGPYSLGLAARGEDDQRRRAVDGERLRDLEALDVGQPDVEQHELRSQGAGGGADP